MATVGDLAALSSWAYKPGQTALQAIDNGVWSQINSGNATGTSSKPTSTTASVGQRAGRSGPPRRVAQ